MQTSVCDHPFQKKTSSTDTDALIVLDDDDDDDEALDIWKRIQKC